MKNPKKELQDISDELDQPSIAQKEGRLTSTQRKILEKTMQRHDKALKKLADM